MEAAYYKKHELARKNLAREEVYYKKHESKLNLKAHSVTRAVWGLVSRVVLPWGLTPQPPQTLDARYPQERESRTTSIVCMDSEFAVT